MAGLSLISRLFGASQDEHAVVRSLWHALVGAARDKAWYAQHGIADTLGGRFDAITLVLSLVLLRMEREDALKAPSVLLTELFVTDMDGQLRESGVGDMVVGKHIGRLMSVLGGRLGAYRDALAKPGNAELTAALLRNVTLVEGADAVSLAGALREFAGRLEKLDADALMAGNLA